MLARGALTWVRTFCFFCAVLGLSRPDPEVGVELQKGALLAGSGSQIALAAAGSGHLKMRGGGVCKAECLMQQQGV